MAEKTDVRVFVKGDKQRLVRTASDETNARFEGFLPAPDEKPAEAKPKPTEPKPAAPRS